VTLRDPSPPGGPEARGTAPGAWTGGTPGRARGVLDGTEDRRPPAPGGGCFPARRLRLEPAGDAISLRRRQSAAGLRLQRLRAARVPALRDRPAARFGIDGARAAAGPRRVPKAGGPGVLQYPRAPGLTRRDLRRPGQFRPCPEPSHGFRAAVESQASLLARPAQRCPATPAGASGWCRPASSTTVEPPTATSYTGTSLLHERGQPAQDGVLAGPRSPLYRS
jgi:hypothetical protein